VEVPENVDSFLVATEATVGGIREGDGKRIVWARPDAPGRRELAVVYLHGFSADPHELDPIPRRLADSLGANLFITRLTGHGLRDGVAMGDATGDDWLRDTEEAMAVGARLGERVILVGTSTGGTLAAWAAAASRRRDRLAAVVLVSPNFGPLDRRAEMLLLPWGGMLARLIEGPEHCWTPANAGQARHWTTCYPTRALLSMMALVEHVRRADLSRVTAPTLVLYSPEDEVVDPAAILRYVARFGAPVRDEVQITGVEEPGRHVLAGDIVSPGTTDTVAAEVLAFLRRQLPPPDSTS
jgi:alpha-beta hydrolase superfamily lysophospholipase